MLILECVEQKKECSGPKGGGLLPISSLGSRHCSGVATGWIVACTAGVPAITIKNQRARARWRAWEGLLQQASLGALS